MKNIVRSCLILRGSGFYTAVLRVFCPALVCFNILSKAFWFYYYFIFIFVLIFLSSKFHLFYVSFDYLFSSLKWLGTIHNLFSFFSGVASSGRFFSFCCGLLCNTHSRRPVLLWLLEWLCYNLMCRLSRKIEMLWSHLFILYLLLTS